MAGLRGLSRPSKRRHRRPRRADPSSGPGRRRGQTHGAASASRLTALLACFGLCFAAHAGPQDEAAEAVTGPVAIRTYQLLPPSELAGSGIDPEVSVRVTIDAEGAVSEVEVLGVEPSSEFDELLAERVRRSVGAWRYGPARGRDGRPVPSTLAWRMKFESPGGQSNGGMAGTRFDPQLDVLVAAGGLPGQAERPSLLQLAEALNQKLQVAEKYIDDEHRRRRQTPRFVVVSDLRDDHSVDILAGNMEAAFSVFHRQFDEHIEPLPSRFRIFVFLYESSLSLRRLQEEIMQGFPASGFYHSPGLLAFHCEVDNFDQLLHTMLHEAFHAFSDTYITGPGRDLPQWAEEGTAEYFGHSRIRRGELIPGGIARGGYSFSHQSRGPVRVRTVSSWTLEDAKEATGTGRAPSIDELFEATRDTFYGSRHQYYYSFSWLLTHFLQHGRKEWEGGAQFAHMLLYLAEGYASSDALLAVFGATPAELEDEFQRYVRRL